jgi:serine/threonine-protein kinase
MTSSSLREGTSFAGRYRVGRLVAAGSMGAVYQAIHLETGRTLALKAMLPQLLDDPEMCERFMREARLASQVNSKFIADVLDAGVDHETGMPFLVMELLTGEDLGKRLKRAGGFPPGEALVYLHQIALALTKTHRAGIVHRDLKPANLFLVQSDEEPPFIKILDFGLAKILAEGRSSGAGSVALGTPLYMAPEQFDRRAISPAVDVYAFGLIAFALLVGKAYWSQDLRKSGDPVAFALLAARGPQEPPCRRAAERGVVLPAAFDAWFARATAVEPAARFPTVLEAVTALAEVLDISLPVYGRASSSGADGGGSVPVALPSISAPPAASLGTSEVTGSSLRGPDLSSAGSSEAPTVVQRAARAAPFPVAAAPRAAPGAELPTRVEAAPPLRRSRRALGTAVVIGLCVLGAASLALLQRCSPGAERQPEERAPAATERAQRSPAP